MKRKRKDGWYWVKFGQKGKWVVRGHYKGVWLSVSPFSEPLAPNSIGPRIKEPKR